MARLLIGATGHRPRGALLFDLLDPHSRARALGSRSLVTDYLRYTAVI